MMVEELNDKVVEKKSFCRICGSNCGIIVEMRDEQVVRVRADTEHPLSAGYTCPKGRALPMHHHQSDRLEVPMIREDGILKPTSWDHVLDDLGGRLKKILDESGPRGIGLFTGGGGYLDACAHMSWQAFRNTLKTPSNYGDLTIDSVAKVIVSELVTGHPGVMTRADLERCKLVIFMGTNPVISHGHTWTLCSPTASLRAMRARGTEVWVVDPRYTETAQRADHYLASRPGMDYAILGYLIRELLIDGADLDYVRQYVQGVERLREAVERFTLDWASTVSGIASEQLVTLLASVRRAGRIAVDTGTGVTMSRAGNVIQWLSWALMIITGSMDREGGAWASPGSVSRMDRLDIPAAPDGGWNLPGPESRPELKSIIGDYPCAAMPDEIAAGHLRAMVVFGGNIEACLPNTERTVAALKQLDVMATFDVRPTATTALSTHVLPAKDQLERSDINYVNDMYFPVVTSQYTPAMLEPVGQRKGVWWVIGQLGKRMGLDFLPGIDVDTATDDTVIAHIMANGNVDFEALCEQRIISQPPIIGWVERYVMEKIGGWRVAPQPLVDQLKDLEARERDIRPDALVLIPRRQKYHENSKLLELRDKPHVFLNPADALANGVEDGSRVRVSSTIGSVERVVKLDETLRRGAINVPHGWSDDLNVNHLTDTRDVDSLTGMVRYSGFEVSLELV